MIITGELECIRSHLQRLPLLTGLSDFPHDLQNSHISLPPRILNLNVFLVSGYCFACVLRGLPLRVTQSQTIFQAEISHSKPKPNLNSRNAGRGDQGMKFHLLFCEVWLICQDQRSPTNRQGSFSESGETPD